MSGRVTGLEQWWTIYLVMCVWVQSVAKHGSSCLSTSLPASSSQPRPGGILLRVWVSPRLFKLASVFPGLAWFSPCIFAFYPGGINGRPTRNPQTWNTGKICYKGVAMQSETSLHSFKFGHIMSCLNVYTLARYPVWWYLRMGVLLSFPSSSQGVV